MKHRKFPRRAAFFMSFALGPAAIMLAFGVSGWIVLCGVFVSYALGYFEGLWAGFGKGRRNSHAIRKV